MKASVRPGLPDGFFDMGFVLSSHEMPLYEADRHARRAKVWARHDVRHAKSCTGSDKINSYLIEADYFGKMNVGDLVDAAWA
jgi:hypothetical protein